MLESSNSRLAVASIILFIILLASTSWYLSENIDGSYTFDEHGDRNYKDWRLIFVVPICLGWIFLAIIIFYLTGSWIMDGY